MGTVNGGQLVAQALKKEGVECIFGLSGGHIMPIMYGCREQGITVYALHEVYHRCPVVRHYHLFVLMGAKDLLGVIS